MFKNLSNATWSGRVIFKMRYLVIFLIIFLVCFFMLSNTSKSPEYFIHDVPREHIQTGLSGETTIFVITPTYSRPVQKAELTRLSHVLRLVSNIHWVIVEDSEKATDVVTNLLKKSKVPFSHLVQPTPPSWKLKSTDFRWTKARGVLQRNAALEWVRANLGNIEKGVIYFADDDNTYTTELFEEIRTVQTVGVWPVGLVGGLYVETPLVENGKVIGFNSAWRPERPFPIDMAGFAVSLKLLLSKPEAAFSYESEGGFQETDFLSKLTTKEQLEAKAANCTQILVWHTRTEKPQLVYEEKLRKKGLKPSNWQMEL